MAYPERSPPRLVAVDVGVRVPGRKLVEKLDVDCAGGTFLAVLGANGAGTSMTLKTLALQREPDTGRVEIEGRPRMRWKRRDLARSLGMLPQAIEDPFPATVLEAVLIGRHPHLDFWEWEGEADHACARSALAQVDLAGLEQRALDSLSGGERRRVAIAALLAQDPSIAVLDEPTNHLDPHHQLQILQLFRARADRGDLILASLHDASLAARYADKVLLLYGDGAWAFGPSATTLTTPNLERLYRSPVNEILWRDRRVFVVG